MDVRTGPYVLMWRGYATNGKGSFYWWELVKCGKLLYKQKPDVWCLSARGGRRMGMGPGQLGWRHGPGQKGEGPRDFPFSYTHKHIPLEFPLNFTFQTSQLTIKFSVRKPWLTAVPKHTKHQQNKSSTLLLKTYLENDWLIAWKRNRKGLCVYGISFPQSPR